jgi:uncharacterized protein GlcG (DUF336 family)
MMKKLFVVLMLVVTGVFGSASSARQAPPSSATPARRPRVDVAASLPREEARTIIEAAIAYVRADNGHAAIAVVDDNGHLVSMDRMDGTSGFYERFALGKAVGAVALQQSTADSAEQFRTNPQRFFSMLSLLQGEVLLIPGGFPLIVEGRILGGVGSAGHFGEGDVLAAKAGIAAWERLRQGRR